MKKPKAVPAPKKKFTKGHYIGISLLIAQVACILVAIGIIASIYVYPPTPADSPHHHHSDE